MANADDQADPIKKLQAEIDLLTKEKEKADLEQKKAEAEKLRAQAERDRLAASSPESRSLDLLKTEKELAEAQKAKAEAEKATLAAKLPSSDVKALEGKTTLDDNVVFEIQLLSHDAMRKVVGRIASEISSQNAISKVVLYNERDAASLGTLQAVLGQFDVMKNRYEELLKPGTPSLVAPLMAAAVGTVLVKSVIDLVSLFRTDTDIKGKAVVIDDLALVAALSRELSARGSTRKPPVPVAVIYPPAALPGALSGVTGNLLTKLRELTGKRALAETTVAAFEAKSDDQKKADPFRLRVLAAKALNAEYDKLLAFLMATDEKTATTTLSMLLRAEVLSTHIKEDGTAILLMKYLTGGGENIVTRNLFTGSHLFHSGGCLVAYLLLGKDGAIVSSGVYGDFRARVPAEGIKGNLSVP